VHSEHPTAAGYRLDSARGVLRRPDGTAVPLRPKTAAVLSHLRAHAGRLVTRDALMDAAWPGLFVTDDSLTQCVVELRRALGEAGGLRLRTLPRRGYVLEGALAEEDSAAPPAQAASDAPVLAVLPFENLARAPRWDPLCDGLTEDIITDLARDPALRVIARTSSFAWRGRAADVREIGAALGARYVLEGSVQADAGRVAVTAQLIEAASGAHVWAERHAHPEEGLFAIQEAVVARVAAAVGGLAGSVARAELSRARRAAPASFHAWELYVLGYEQEARLDQQGTRAAIGLLEQAVAADPTLSRAWTVLGLALGNAVGNAWADDPAAARARQQAAIRRAVELDPGDSLALEELGAMLARQGDPAGAEAAFRRAAEAGANHADTLALLAKYRVEVLDEGATARAMTSRAAALNPFAPAWYRLGALRVAFFTGDTAHAAELGAGAPPWRLPRLIQVVALAQLGRDAEAAAALAEHRARFGPGGVAAALAGLPPLCVSARALLDDGLRRAGLDPAV
jgi:TolB-like protein